LILNLSQVAKIEAQFSKTKYIPLIRQKSAFFRNKTLISL